MKNNKAALDLANELERLSKLDLTGAQLYDAVIGSGLADPEATICKEAGYDELGVPLCSNCVLGRGGAPGCIADVVQILNRSLSGKIGKAQLDLIRTVSTIRAKASSD